MTDDEAVPRLLLIEDDRELAGLLGRLLRQNGYAVTAAGDGQSGLHLGLTRDFDVLVVDRGLPIVEGLELLGTLRRRGVATPALVLSARDTVADRVDGLDAGAEDYLGKPFDVEELLARLRALRRRHLDRARVLSIGGGRLDLDDRTVSTGRGGATVQLSEREADLLATLASRPGRVFSRQELLDRVFSGADSAVAVDTYVHYCRRKLGHGVIDTIRGVGYRLGRL